MGYVLKLVKQREKRENFYDLVIFRGRCGLLGTPIERIGYIKLVGLKKRIMLVNRQQLSKWFVLGLKVNKPVARLLKKFRWK